MRNSISRLPSCINGGMIVLPQAHPCFLPTYVQNAFCLMRQAKWHVSLNTHVLPRHNLQIDVEPVIRRFVEIAPTKPTLKLAEIFGLIFLHPAAGFWKWNRYGFAAG